MRIRNLFYAFLALPLIFAACEENKVDDVKDPVVNVVAGEATENSVSFTITSSEAEKVAWFVTEATATAPTASEVFIAGTEVAANGTVEVTVTDLEADTEYLVIAAAMNSKTAVKSTVNMTTLKGKELVFTLTSEPTMSFEAEGGNGLITYTIEWIEASRTSPVEVEVVCDAEWVKIDGHDNAETLFRVEANEGAARDTKITITYLNESLEVTVSQAANGETPGAGNVEFTADKIDIEYFGTEFSDNYNYYFVLSDNGLNDYGYMRDNGIYYHFDIYTTVGATNGGGVLPNGVYTFDSTNSYAAGTFTEEYGYHAVVVDGEPTYGMYSEGTLTISDGKVEAEIVMKDGSVHKAVYEGSLAFGNGGGGSTEFKATHTATSWTWGGASSYGNVYSVAGEGFSMDVHFPGQFATEAGLLAGEYIWTNTSWWGYNEFDNEFTTRNFLVDGAYASIVRTGSALVEVEGEVYHIEVTLNAEDGTVYMIEYTGEIGAAGSGDQEAETVTMTSMEYVSYNSAYFFFEYKLTNANGDTMHLLVNDYAAKESYIPTGDFEWITKSMCGNKGFFSTDKITVGGTTHRASSGSMSVVTDVDTKAMDITVTVVYNDGASHVFKYAGKVGDTGNEGGEDDTDGISTIASVLALSEGATIGTKIEGVVVSNYELNNLTSKKGMYVQDETGALQFYLAANHEIAFGTKVQIDLTEATLGSYNGAVQVSGLALDKITTISTGNTVTPKTVSMADFLANKYEGQYVAIEGVQVVADDLASTWVVNNKHTSIKMEDAEGNNFVVFSSKYATYGAETVAQGSGTIKGISSINNGNIQIIFAQASDYAGLTGARLGEETPGGGDTEENYENWVFTASLSSFMNGTLTLTDGTRTVTCKFNNLAAYIPVGDTSGYAYAYDFTVDGVAVDIANVSGSISLDLSAYYVSIDFVIDGVKYTGTSTNPVA